MHSHHLADASSPSKPKKAPKIDDASYLFQLLKIFFQIQAKTCERVRNITFKTYIFERHIWASLTKPIQTRGEVQIFDFVAAHAWSLCRAFF